MDAREVVEWISAARAAVKLIQYAFETTRKIFKKSKGKSSGPRRDD